MRIQISVVDRESDVTVQRYGTTLISKSPAAVEVAKRNIMKFARGHYGEGYTLIGKIIHDVSFFNEEDCCK